MTNWRLPALVIVVSLLHVLYEPASAAPPCPQDPAACACQKGCDNIPGRGIRRAPLIHGFVIPETWALFNQPPALPLGRVRIDPLQILFLCQDAMAAWTSISLD